MVTSVLTLASFVKVFQTAFLGPRRSRLAEVEEVPGTMLLGMFSLTLVVLGLSLFRPGPWLISSSRQPKPSLIKPVTFGQLWGVVSDVPKIHSGFGYWDVVSCWCSFSSSLSSCCGFALRALGLQGGTEQDDIFFCGNDVPEKGEDYAVPASGAYWGFTKALSGFYELLTAWHSGIATEYTGYLVVFTALMLSLALL
jgi:hypothetical protein